ncbi:MAG: hypothetical protein ACI89Z_000840 [Porticoccus sp.]|jgi:hypothetical protein
MLIQTWQCDAMTLSGRHTVPQIWVDETHVGGCDGLHRLNQSGQLETLISLSWRATLDRLSGRLTRPAPPSEIGSFKLLFLDLL